jgi:hypothetical protein
VGGAGGRGAGVARVGRACRRGPTEEGRELGRAGPESNNADFDLKRISKLNTIIFDQKRISKLNFSRFKMKFELKFR